MSPDTLPTLHQELARKQPAQVAVRPVQRHRAPVPRKPTPGQHVETLVGDRKALNLEIRRLGGRLVDTGVTRVIQSGEHASLLELRVIVKDEVTTPRWARVCVILGAALAGLAVVLGALAWVLSALDFASLAVFAAVVVVALYLMLRKSKSSARGVFVQVTTSVHVR